MDIRFQTKDAANSQMVADHVRRRLNSRLRHRSDRVEHVEVRLGDTESRRVHHDMYCLMQVHLIGTPVATVIEVGTDMYATIDRAVDRVGRLTDAQLGPAGAQPAGASNKDARR